MKLKRPPVPLLILQEIRWISTAFRDDSAYKNGVSISRVYLDAVSPNIKSVKLSSNQKINNLNDNENYYFKGRNKINSQCGI